MNNLICFGKELKNLRNCLGLTQQEMSDLLGISKPVVIAIEKEPLKITKIVALSMMTNSFNEIYKRSEHYKRTKVKLNSSENTEEFISALNVFLKLIKMQDKLISVLYNLKSENQESEIKSLGSFFSNLYSLINPYHSLMKLGLNTCKTSLSFLSDHDSTKSNISVIEPFKKTWLDALDAEQQLFNMTCVLCFVKIMAGSITYLDNGKDKYIDEMKNLIEYLHTKDNTSYIDALKNIPLTEHLDLMMFIKLIQDITNSEKTIEAPPE